MSAPQHILCEDKSATFTGWAYTDSQTLKPWAYHPRPLGPKDVEIEITHGGCCGSDVHIICGRMVNPTVGPIIAGHEIIGKVVAAGPESGHQVGDLVGSGGLTNACGDCVECNAGQEQLCSKMTLVFNDYFKDERGGIPQGGFADRVRINGDFVHKVPSNISPAEAAPLFCAGLTTYSPLKNHGAGPNKTVGVIGIGGLGHLAIQWAAAMKCKEVVAISTSDNKRDEAFKLGATKFVNSKDPEQFKAAFHSIDILLVAGISKDVDWNELLSLVANRGTFVLLAVPESLMTFSPYELLMREVNVTGSLIGGRRITAEMLEFASKHNVRPWIEKRPMSDINAAVQYVIDGKPRYRVVLETEAAAKI
ncbi:hypothetical protein MVEG_12407 [Podila verticillata NRRL 6337]|uniref:Enoyl reductase (ER) domain-containing protein n=1 Tax=Podila verticillata NRRL 6337 TaxID=1069443 RepID=A0A086TII0_9FUNG|nr:hypothetical protein MVEG_12407 [Podila verticillata NRRL 6337]